MTDYFGHNTCGVDCWCNPTIETMENGNKVVIHNYAEATEMTELDRVRLAIAASSSSAEVLRNVRKARGLTILQVSEKAGLHRNYVSSIERGDKINSASIAAIAKIAHAIGCDLRITLKPFEEFTRESND